MIESPSMEKDFVENSWVSKTITIGNDKDSSVILSLWTLH